MITRNWLNAVQQIMTVLNKQSLATIADDGTVNPQSYIYQATGSRAVFPPVSLIDIRRIS